MTEPSDPPGPQKMLRWRLLLGTLIIAVFAGLCWIDSQETLPGFWLLPVVVVIAMLATKEVLDLLAVADMRPVPWVIQTVNVASIISLWLASSERFLSMHLYLWVLGLVLLVFPLYAVFIAEMCRYRKPGGHLANMAAGIFVWAYVGLMLMFAMQLRLVWGMGALASWILVTKLGDTGAYAVGHVFGRHKMAPLLSPGKTIEGAAGALASSCLGSWLMFQWLLPATMTGPWWGWIVYGLLVGTAGIVGDLAESLMKRDVGAKDSSTWLPGFGGVLDIVDSLLLSAPVAYFCWECGFVGK